ncbi:hypothetical protein DUI87_10069 [Hirundo rustica rustica]|uniref:Uncharacterized protein n=1 Tax=Hirundo rustica rustica TaxID=333673 RepID=A0A3M0KH22_HIRRU|nr:hypothetical protein DUI87_10069 [Hirundo rustica rustica]
MTVTSLGINTECLGFPVAPKRVPVIGRSTLDVGAEESKSQEDCSANALVPMDNHTASPCHLSDPGQGQTSAYIPCAGRLRSKPRLPDKP